MQKKWIWKHKKAIENYNLHILDTKKLSITRQFGVLPPTAAETDTNTFFFFYYYLEVDFLELVNLLLTINNKFNCLEHSFIHGATALNYE